MKLLSFAFFFMMTPVFCFYWFSDPETTTVQDPVNSHTIHQKKYSINDPNPMEYGANWIWTNGSSRTATF
jgi:hypothetical protein